MSSRTYAVVTSAADVLSRVEGLATDGRRVLLGITGPPGCGKTTFADQLADLLGSRLPGAAPDRVARVPMDGYHLADTELARLGRLARKGAPDTFDAAGYVALLERLAAGPDEVVYAPAFERTLEQPVAGSIAVSPAARVVITEGNYLLLAGGGWERVRKTLDEVWYLEIADDERRRRLVARHRQFGKSGPEARAWTSGTDESNAELVRATSHLADLRVSSGALAAHTPATRSEPAEGART